MDVELACLFVKFDTDEIAARSHREEVFESVEIDADDAAVGLVCLEPAGGEMHVHHAEVGGVDRADRQAILVESDLALIDQRRHGVEGVLECVDRCESAETHR